MNNEALGVLYVCGTPIGNLEDVTHRLHRILSEVDTILCEDTRVTRNLLSRYAISTPLMSCNQFQETQRVEWVLARLMAGKSVALVSDAGTPGICDPGYRLIAAVRDAGYRVDAIPGPSAIVSLLSIAGLPVDRFTFCGFVPKRVGDWRVDCQSSRRQSTPLVFFESPNRICATLSWIREFDPGARVALGKELTKKFEIVLTGTPSELLEASQLESPKGEWCGIVEFTPEPEADYVETVSVLKSMGLSNRHIIDISTKILHFNKNDIYKLLIQNEKE
jgi:16S rRNA (cytidine1402-2'-O)-methyltransferase